MKSIVVWQQQKMKIFYHTSFIEALFIHNHNPPIRFIKSEIGTLYFYKLFFTKYKKKHSQKMFFNKTKRNVRWVDYTYFPYPKESQKFHRQRHGIELEFPQVRKSKKLQLWLLHGYLEYQCWQHGLKKGNNSNKYTVSKFRKCVE